jgi:hypothetical protein
MRTWIGIGVIGAGLLAAPASRADGARPGATAIDQRVIFAPRSSDKNHVYVAHLYQDLLARQGDSAGVDALVQMLARGASRTQVVQALLAGEEYRGLVVRDLYTRVLHRTPTPAEAQSMGAVLGSGGTEEQVTVTLASSPEYFHQRANDSPATFVDQIFQDLLGRAPDLSARASFVARLGGSTPRSAVVQSVMTSPEYAARVVQADYTKYLQRMPTAIERAQGVGIVQPGRSRDLQLMLLTSQEYCDR